METEEQKSNAPVPPTQLLIRQSTGMVTERETSYWVHTGPLTELAGIVDSAGNDCADETKVKYSRDGRLLAVASPDVVNVYTSEDQKLVCTIKQAAVTHMHFSPLASFIILHGPKVKNMPNLVIYNVKTAQEVLSFSLAEFNNFWPLQWSNDESVLAHLVPNHVNFMDGQDPSKRLGKLKFQGIKTMGLAGSGEHVCIFVPEASTPASAMIYSVTRKSGDGSDGVDRVELSEEPIASQIFFRAKEATIHWSPISNGALVTAMTDVDKTDANYYGESQLHLLLVEGKSFAVPAPKAGPIHDAKWGPQGQDFCVIQGHQPAKIMIYKASDCTAVRDFGNASRNVIMFSPHGRFVCFGGFQGLAGEMDFWDKTAFKKIGTAKDIHMPGSFAWTPDSRNFITAALFPRRRVDEGFKVWTYYGELVYETKMPKLREIAVRPAMEGVFPNRPVSPRLKNKSVQKDIAAKQTAAAGGGAYVPPQRRAQGAPASNIIKDTRDVSGPKKVVAQPTEEQAAAAVAAKAKKNKDRRERQKQKKIEEEEQQAQETEEKANKAADEQQAKLAGLSNTDVLQKQLKKLQKLQRQVVDLREQKAAGKSMDPSQLDKIKKNENIEAEILEIDKLLIA